MAYLRLEPVVTAIKRSKQGSLDPESAWAIIARKNQLQQMLIRFGAQGDIVFLKKGKSYLTVLIGTR